jgi:hypothetical protein
MSEMPGIIVAIRIHKLYRTIYIGRYMSSAKGAAPLAHHKGQRTKDKTDVNPASLPDRRGGSPLQKRSAFGFEIPS